MSVYRLTARYSYSFYFSDNHLEESKILYLSLLGPSVEYGSTRCNHFFIVQVLGRSQIFFGP